MKRFGLLPVWQQVLLGFTWGFPWLAFGLLSTDILPQAWQFTTWPESVRVISSLLFLGYIVAELTFSIRWFVVNGRETALGDRCRSS